jgi:hypothetical protein
MFTFSYPDYTPILIRAVEIWTHDPTVTTPVLKFFGELVQNRSQRLQFDVSSPNGILLFREISKLICCHGKNGKIVTPRSGHDFRYFFFLRQSLPVAGRAERANVPDAPERYLGVFPHAQGDPVRQLCEFWRFQVVRRRCARQCSKLHCQTHFVDTAKQFAGVPEIVAGLLHSGGEFGPGPHHLLVHARTERFLVHSGEHIGGFEGVGWVNLYYPGFLCNFS